MKILLAIDGSKCSEAAIHEIVRRPWPENTRLKILSVVEMPFLPTAEMWAMRDNYYNEIAKSSYEKAEAVAHQAEEQIRAAKGKSFEVITEIAEGQAQSVILDEAERWGADLILLGSHGRRGLQRFLLGSVSQAVATHANCSVEIVREPLAA
jgi:nucleotide-binding universal stress UspA family protein